MKIAVVGGGIFGTTIASALAESEHRVSLFEEKKMLLQCASLVNQYRLHRGYHYPRSHQTIQQCVGGYQSFLARYGECIVSGVPHYYGIPKAGSLTSADQCSKIWNKYNLRHWHSDRRPLAKPELLEDWFEVEEVTISVRVLRELIISRLNRAGVALHVGVNVNSRDLRDFDKIVVCAYSANNSFLDEEKLPCKEWQYEVCEKPVFRLPPYLQRKSVVLLDGEFMCIDPIGNTADSVVGSVRHAILARNTGVKPLIPVALRGYINQGLIPSPAITNADLFRNEGAKYFDEFDLSMHLGSYYTIRMVPSDREYDDARPTEVASLSPRVTVVYSGKIVTCVDAAEMISKSFDEI